jgi:MFS family permease
VVIHATVFVTGAAVMLLELLGTRVIAPFYGTSLYVWSALIAVTMVALSLGYYFGGILADRYGRKLFIWILLAASGGVFMIPVADGQVLLLTDPLGLRLGSLVSAFLLFMPALVALGMAGPVAVKVGTTDLEALGVSAGRLYAVSTIGSVFGTFLLAYFLFPSFGTNSILLTLASVLLLAALIHGLLARARQRTDLMVMGLIVALGCAAIWDHLSSQETLSPKGFSVISERESLYGKVRVIDNPMQDLRLLSSDASVIGAASIGMGLNRLTYQQIVGLLPLMRSGMSRGLVIGQGAGHMAGDLFASHGVRVDTIELDPAVAEAADKHFGFVKSGLQRIGDGRYEVRKLQGPYDLVIHDCFTGGSEPTHLLTREALLEIKRTLSEKGLMALNLVAFRSPGLDLPLRSVVKTVSSVFGQVKVYRSEPDNDFNDFIILASDQPLDASSRKLTTAMVGWLQERETPVDVTGGILITDDYNPLESLQVKKSEHYREQVADWLGAEILLD